MLFERMMRAARLDSNLYEEVEHDINATSQAATVVGIVALCAGLGNAIAVAMAGNTGGAIGAFIGQIIGAYISWVAWSYITYWVGTTIYKGVATPGELLRTLGFAQSTNLLNVLAFVPFLGGLIALVAGIWTLIAGIIALRQALDITTGQAVITASIGAIPMLLLWLLYGGLLGSASMFTGAVR